MMPRSACRGARRTLPLAAALLLAGQAIAADGAAHWYASLYADNPDWIQVDIDLSGLAQNALVSNAVVTVRMLDASAHPLGDRSFTFTGSDQPLLAGGNHYREYFPSPYAQAKKAVGIKLSSTLRTKGGYYSKKIIPDTPSASSGTSTAVPISLPLRILPDAKLTPASAIVVGSVPARQIVLHLPQDGQRNDNQTIGPFCCTGTTATIRDSAGKVAGYVYFFGFDDAVNLPGGKASAAATIRILLSAGDAASQSGSAVFDAASWSPATARTVQVGSLRYTVTLDAQTLAMADRKRFDMGSLRATVRVAGVE